MPQRKNEKKLPEKKGEEKNPETGPGWRELIFKEVIDEEKQELLQMSEISLILNEYQDIFSDFDPRPYSQRSLSDDFLGEVKKASKVKTTNEEIELKFLIPENIQQESHESIIKKRLHEYFRKHYGMLRKEVEEIRRKGILLAITGFALMMLATYIHALESKELPMVFLITVTEPAGWFTVWFGMEQIFYTSAQKKDDLEFYEKMAKAKISFVSY